MIPTKIDSPVAYKAITPAGERPFLSPEEDEEKRRNVRPADRKFTIDPADSAWRARFEGEQRRHASRLEPLELPQLLRR